MAKGQKHSNREPKKPKQPKKPAKQEVPLVDFSDRQVGTNAKPKKRP